MTPQEPDEETGVVVARGTDGRRSSSALGRSAVATALRARDPVGAGAAERETNWRSGYLGHFRRLVEAGLAGRSAELTIAADGLGAVRDQFRYLAPNGVETSMAEAAGADSPVPETVEVAGDGEREPTFSLPLRGKRLTGSDLAVQLDAWTRAGAMEPSAADLIREVMTHPEWLRLDGRTVVVLGAGAEMGPLPSLLRWGARVAALDLPRADVWSRVMPMARKGAGTMLAPGPDAAAAPPGIDLLTGIASAAAWIARLDGPLVLGNYVYADGITNLRLAAAVDCLTTHLQDSRPDTALAFLATPTDVFVVPGEAVEYALDAYDRRSRGAKLVGRPLRTLSGGRLLRRPYARDVEPGINDSLVRQQGPNYALAKRLQRWRAATARDAGTPVSMNVAPPTRTRSVVKNRALAAAYAGAHRFAVEVFEPATASTLMAGLLVADLHGAAGPPREFPWQDEAFAAVHGGLWRSPYEPRSALGLAAMLGYGAARS
jgi:hypothetical protein